ncbi:Hypothetical protein PHPALM_15093, partial [Phytophthora palmivora]
MNATAFPEHPSNQCHLNISVADLSTVGMKDEISCPDQMTNHIAKPKKKRVRRQKLELEYLRKLVVNLEGQMSELKAKQPNGCNQAEVKFKGSSTWKGIAERQLKERVRVEEKNQQLRSSLEGQLKLAMKLESLLRKRPRDEESWQEISKLAEAKRFKPSVYAATDDEIFADQLAHVLRAHLDVDRVFGGREFSDPRASFCDLHVMNDPHSDTGVAFVKKASSMMPFDIQVTERAFWRALAIEGTKGDRYFLDERVTTDSLISSSYGLNFKPGQFQANVLGKQTYRKYTGDGYVMIMWKWVVDPIEVNGTKFCGVRCHETGWIMLRGDDIANQDLQVGALTDFVVNLHDTITEVCSKMISKVLVEEDWNLNEEQQAPIKPKKKRIRRQKLELEYLRDLVGKLEEQMTQLKSTQREDWDRTSAIKTEPKGPSIWKGIAERQQKERARVEEKNQKLRASLEGQLKLATKLERLLRKRPRDEEMDEMTGYKRNKPLVDTAVCLTDDEIFADQLAHVQRAHLDADMVFGGPEYADRTASFCDLHVMSDTGSDTGVAFVTKACSMIPFDVQVTEKAFWRAFAADGPKKMNYFHDERLSTENLVARSYGLNFNAGSFRTNVRGKQTYRKYVGDGCVMILWKSFTEPVEINDIKLSGLRCNQI